MKNFFIILFISLYFTISFSGCSSSNTIIVNDDNDSISSLPIAIHQFNEEFQSISYDGLFYFSNGITCKLNLSVTPLELNRVNYNNSIKEDTLEYLYNTIYIGEYYDIETLDLYPDGVYLCNIYMNSEDILSEYIIEDGYGVLDEYNLYNSDISLLLQRNLKYYEYNAKLYKYGLWYYYPNEMNYLDSLY